MRPIELKRLWIEILAYTAGRTTGLVIVGSFVAAGCGATSVFVISGDRHVIDTIWTLEFVVVMLSAMIGLYSFVFYSLGALIQWMILGEPQSLKDLGFEVPEMTRDLFNYETLLFDYERLLIDHEDTGWFPHT